MKNLNGIKRISISRSVKLTALPSEKFKISYLSVYFSRPLCEKEAPFNALLPEVLTRSCEKYPTMLSLSSALQSLYGATVDSVNTLMGENHIFGLQAAFPENRYAFDGTDILSEVISIISEMLLNPLLDKNGGFDESVVESEKAKLCGRIRAIINNPATYAARRCEEIMCADERYSISPSGTLDSVSSVSAQELYRYYLALAGSTEVNIYYSGSADTDILEEKFRAIFKNFDTPTNLEFLSEVRRSAPEKLKTVIEEQSVSQGKLVIGLRSGFCLSDKDYYLLPIVNSLLGSSPTSKLFMNVREKMSLCYYCSSRPNALKGTMLVSSGIEVENFEKARDAVFAQIDALKNGDISDFELASAKKSLVNAYKELSDSPAGLIAWYLTRSFAGRSDSPDDVIRQVVSATKEDIIASAKRLSPDTVYFLKGSLTPPNEDTTYEYEE